MNGNGAGCRCLFAYRKTCTTGSSTCKGRRQEHDANRRAHLDQALVAERLLGGRRTAALLRSLAGLVEICQGAGSPEHDDDWLDDRGQFNQVTDAWNRLLDDLRPANSEEDRLQQQHELQSFREAVERAPNAKGLRDHAARMAAHPMLNSNMRAEWAALAKVALKETEK